MGITAVVLGHSGAVGSALLRQLLCDGRFSKVTVVGRREIAYDEPGKDKLVQKVVDFEQLSKSKDAFNGHNIAFCCLGTTRNEAGSAEKFIRIDHDYVVESSKLIYEENKMEGTSDVCDVHFLYVSAGGANINSPFLYTKTKGLTEKDLADIPFKQVSIFHPALLEIEQERSGGSRFAESVAFAILPVIKWFSPKGVSVPVSSVASAMIEVAMKKIEVIADNRVRIFSNADIHNLASKQNVI